MKFDFIADSLLDVEVFLKNQRILSESGTPELMNQRNAADMHNLYYTYHIPADPGRLPFHNVGNGYAPTETPCFVPRWGRENPTF